MVKGKHPLLARAQAKKLAFKYQGVKRVEGVKGKYYPADDVKINKGPSPVRNPTKIRASITPGTVLVLVAGRFAGKRVVCLKVLSSGLLLVSGPFSVNGVPLRRVNQKYVIATSTKVSLDGVNVSNIDDAFFARAKTATKKGEEALFDNQNKPNEISAARKEAQAKVDASLLANVEKVASLKAYLGARFRLSNSDKPHLMKF